MPEKPIAGQEVERSQEDIDQEYLNYFLKAACEPDENGIVPKDIIRATVESILLLYSGELIYSEQSSEPRDLAIKRIRAEKAGMPKSRAEVRDISEEPSSKFDKAVRLKRGRRSTYQRIDGFREDALRDSKALNNVMTVDDEGRIIPSVDGFRHDSDAVYRVAGYLQAKDSLDNMNWPARNTNEYKNSQRYWRGCIVAAARYASPSILAMSIDEAREQSSRRLRYMTEQIQKIRKTVGGKAVHSALNTDTDTQVRKAELPEEPNTEDESKTSGNEPSLERYIPKDIKEQLISKYAHKAAKVETQVRQGIPRHIAELREFGAPGIYDQQGNIIGVEGKAQQPTAEAIVRADTQPRPNPALKPGVRRLPGYDHQDDPSNPWHF